MPLPTELLESYLATRYTAATPGGEVVIRIGRRHPEVDALLAEAIAAARGGAASWAYLTAWNPRSRRLSDAENRLRQAALIAKIGNRHAYFEGEGIATDGIWREPSLLILGISRAEAVQLGRQFEQNAIVAGEHGGEAELVCLD